VRLSHPGAAFLDRDGTVNVKVPEGSYVERPEELELLPRAADAIRVLNDRGIRVIVVTNQRGIARGRLTEEALAAVHRRLLELLDAAAGATVDAILHCPHEGGTCDCRKPLPGLLLEAKRRWPSIALERSVMIGDALSDVQAGRAAGVRAIHLGVDAPDLSGAVQLALG
jgi:D-glycero-D-manno-heptose 1,7-bisphosphate phosphatase